MKCPECNSRLYTSATVHTDEKTVIRWRLCKMCGFTATTEERLEGIELAGGQNDKKAAS